MIKDNELKNIELIYKAIHQECAIALYDKEAYDHNFSRKVVNISLDLFNCAIKLSNPEIFPNLPNISMESIRDILKSIYEIITGIYFYHEKEDKINELLAKYSLGLNAKKTFTV